MDDSVLGRCDHEGQGPNLHKAMPTGGSDARQASKELLDRRDGEITRNSEPVCLEATGPAHGITTS
jgi:hypothetical protein